MEYFSRIKSMKNTVSAFIELVTISASQTPMASIGLGLLLSSEIALSQDRPSIIKLIFAFAGMVLVISHIMVLNDYFDVEIDKEKPARQALAEIPRRLAGALTVLLLGFGLLFAWLTSQTYFAISLALVLLSAAYSAPPIRYKNIYPFSTIGEASGAFLVFWAGYSLSAPVDARAILVSLIPFLLLVIWRLKHEIRYVQFDKGTGKKTLSVVHGVHKVKLLVRFCALSIIALTLGLFFTGWFSPSFMFFLVTFLSIVAIMSFSSSARAFWYRIKANLYWGFVYFFIVVARVLFS